MAWDSNLTSIQNRLAQLIPMQDDARRIVDEAGLEQAHIAFSDKAINTWHSILEQAHLQNKVDVIVGVLPDYLKEDSILVTAYAKYKAAANSFSPVLPPAPIYTNADDKLLIAARRRFKEHTDQILPHNPASIQDIEVPIVEIKQVESLLQAHQPVLVTGKAGVGKSGVAYRLVRNANDKGTQTLLLDARRLAGITDVTELRNRLGLDEAVFDAMNRIGESDGCRVVIDQLDSVFDTPTAEFLRDFAITCSKTSAIQTIVIARNSDRKNGCLDQLRTKDFNTVEIEPLKKEVVQELLKQLGIDQSSEQLFELGANLLNLDILNRIHQENPKLDFGRISSEVFLWQTYFDVIHAHEQVGGSSQFADEIMQSAYDLAWESLQSSQQTTTLPRSTPRSQQRLIAWNIIEQEHDLVYRFRHEQIRDYLAAADCVESGLTIEKILQKCDLHRTSSLIEWVDKLYTNRPDKYRLSFLKDCFSQNSELPFYSQSTILDRYIHADISTEKDEIIDIILQIIKASKDLRNHFFFSKPHRSWIDKLWDHGFFVTPPPPLIDEQGRQFVEPWDAQLYLTVIAHEVPDMVMRHVATVAGESMYIRYAIDALCKIPANQAAQLLPRILEWIQDPVLADRIDHPVYQLLLNLVQAGLEEPAFTLFEAMTTPVATGVDGTAGMWRTHRGGIKPRVDYYDLLNQELPLLYALNARRLVDILEQQVRRLTTLVVDSHYDPPYPSYWRSAIENTDQDSQDNFKDKLISVLRSTLEKFATTHPVEIQQIVVDYLLDEQTIFRRFALHLLATFPSVFPTLVAEQLLKPENLDDIHIHHEFFILLRNGYSTLNPAQQAELVTRICGGLSSERRTMELQWLQELQPEEAKEGLAESEKRRIRDRLWMIREHLTGEYATQLTTLVAEQGEPDHPEFSSWHDAIEWSPIHERSAYSEEEIAEMNPDQLVQAIESYSPATDAHPFKRDTLQGLAGTIATVFVRDPMHFAEHINRVVTMDRVFAKSIVGHFANENNSPTIPWQFCLDLVEKILHTQPSQVEEDYLEENSWTSLRLSIVRLLERGSHQSTLFPKELYDRVELLLFEFLKDPDPDLTDENPPPGSFGHDDPFTRSLNYVRPVALALLINLQREKMKSVPGETNQASDTKRQLEPTILNAISQRLEPSIEPSQIVRAVFGRYLLLLYRLDQRWTETHLDQIFPEDESTESTELFRAAFETFLVNYHYCNYVELRKLLYPKYALAIRRTASQAKHGRIDPIQGLAKHLIADYLFGSYDISDPISQSNLLGMFFAIAGSDARYQAAWAAWRFCSDQPDRFWPKIKQLWLRRLNAVKGIGSLVDYQAEFCCYVQLLPIASQFESFADLWDLIIATLPYVFSSYETGNAWNELEKFLEQQVIQEPLRSIDLYRTMRNYTNDPYKFQFTETRRKILTVAAANEQSRSTTLSLLDSIARLGIHGYRDIYERYK